MLAHSADEEKRLAEALARKLPRVVRIGPFDFWIKIWSEEEAAQSGCWGEFSSKSMEIRIQGNHPTRLKLADTVMHELMHGVYWIGNVDAEDEEEAVVETLGVGTIGLLRDNPWLMPWLKEAGL